LSEVCSYAIAEGIVKPRVKPNIAAMNFVLQLDACSNVSVPLTQPSELWSHPGFSSEKPTVIFITGWRSSINNTYSGPVAKAFACRNDTNFIVLDAANFIDTLYTWSALNTELIGQYVAEALLDLDAEYVTKQVHLIGHSLGAQISSAAGRYYKSSTGGDVLPRITGLDPANPCFYEKNRLPGLQRGDADYVDIIHTNPGYAGIADETGDVDFFVEGLNPIKPGCTGLQPITCSHQRAVDYLTESVYPNNTENFRGRLCSSYNQVKIGFGCSRSRTAVMGLDASAFGLYYVDVNPREPYGLDATQYFTPTSSACGACAA
ncbi:hypothetical protein KR222_010313, partial [Zaprionus bogoriensis]